MTISLNLDSTLREFHLNVRIELHHTGITVISGPSGSGKSTMLGSIAGFNRTVTGSIKIDGHTWQDSTHSIFVAPHKRDVGYIFQQPYLFPHLNIKENILFGYKQIPPATRRFKPDDVIDALKLSSMMEAKTHQLSGGERQKVCLARALLTSPRLWLLDEPLSSLDVESKVEILELLPQFLAESKLPTLYVTHDEHELTKLADYCLYLNHGKIISHGPFPEIGLLSPSKVKGFASILEGVIDFIDHSEGLSRASFEGGSVWIPGAAKPVGSKVRLRIPGSEISISLAHHEDTSILNSIRCRIESIRQSTLSRSIIVLKVGSQTLRAMITNRSRQKLDLREGMEVFAQLKATMFVSPIA